MRYRWRPSAGERTIPDDEARERGRNYLGEELAGRLAQDPVEFELQFQIAEEDDPLDDPTAVWAEERNLVAAGRLEITEVVEDPEVGDHIEVFDPMRLVDGIEPSDDPLIAARDGSYAESYRRRSPALANPTFEREAMERERTDHAALSR